jgi:hypothetical protein
MTELDQIIRESFADQATEAPDGADLLHRVRHRDRQLTIRRRVLVAGVAVAVVGTTVPAGYALVRGGGSGTDSVLTAPAADGTAPPTPHLEPARVVIPPVPVSPRWLPGPVTRRFAGIGSLSYHLAGGLPDLAILVGNVKLPSSEPTQPVTVAGTPATSSHEGGWLSVLWQRRPGQWVRVTWSPETEAQYARASGDLDSLIRVAASLRDEPVAVPAPFRLRWLPRGATLGTVAAGEMYFTLPDDGTFVVSVDTDRIPGGLTEATAGRWHGVVGRAEAGDGVPQNAEVRSEVDHWHTAFYASLDRGHHLRVAGPRSDLDERDILAIAAGVTLTGR